MDCRDGLEPSKIGFADRRFDHFSIRQLVGPVGFEPTFKTRFERAASANSSHGPKLGAGGET
jgi:hypothetical protein